MMKTFKDPGVVDDVNDHDNNDDNGNFQEHGDVDDVNDHNNHDDDGDLK